MPDNRKKYSRESADQRKTDLIDATLQVIKKSGMHAATVRTIAEEANVTQGLIRHYFNTKEDLISSAYEAHLSAMTEKARDAVSAENRSAIARLAAFITTSITSPVAGPDPLGVWAGFLPLIRHEKTFLEVHRRANENFRDYLYKLIEQAMIEEGCTPTAQEVANNTLLCGCIIDGIWLEEGLFPDLSVSRDLTELGTLAISRTLQLPRLAEMHPYKPTQP